MKKILTTFQYYIKSLFKTEILTLTMQSMEQIIFKITLDDADFENLKKISNKFNQDIHNDTPIKGCGSEVYRAKPLEITSVTSPNGGTQEQCDYVMDIIKSFR